MANISQHTKSCKKKSKQLTPKQTTLFRGDSDTCQNQQGPLNYVNFFFPQLRHVSCHIDKVGKSKTFHPGCILPYEFQDSLHNVHFTKGLKQLRQDTKTTLVSRRIESVQSLSPQCTVKPTSTLRSLAIIMCCTFFHPSCVSPFAHLIFIRIWSWVMAEAFYSHPVHNCSKQAVEAFRSKFVGEGDTFSSCDLTRSTEECAIFFFFFSRFWVPCTPVNRCAHLFSHAQNAELIIGESTFSARRFPL